MSTRKTISQQIEASKSIKNRMPFAQQAELSKQNTKENSKKLKDLEKQLNQIPSTIESVSLKEAIVYAHYYSAKTDIFILEQPFEHTFHGIRITNKKVTNLKLGKIVIERLLKSKSYKLHLDFKKDTLQNVLDGLTKKTKTTNQLIKETTYVKMLMPINQQKALTHQNTAFSKSLVKRLESELAEIPKEPQGDSVKKSIVYAHYFYGGSDWYITDIVEDRNMLFGYVILNGDTQMAEAGYISIDEIVNNGRIELDFYFTKEPLETILYKKYPDYYSSSKKEKKQPQKKVIKKDATAKIVDHYSLEFRLIRRFYNLIRLHKTTTFRKIQLLYMAYQKAALEQSIRETNSAADLFGKINKKVVALFDAVSPTKSSANIEFTDKALFNQIENYVKGQKINYAITLLKSYLSMQGYKPDTDKVERLLNRIDNAIEKGRVSKDNRLFHQILIAKAELIDYLEKPTQKIEPELIGLSIPARHLCTNRIKCDGLRKDGKLNKGYQFVKGGSVIKVKKKAV